MCLPLTPYKVEREWKHAGLSCAVVQAREAGNRCGYVRVPPAHPLHGKDYDLPNVSVHGGLTFAEIEPCTEHEDGQGWWFGFDCGHFQDARFDPSVRLEDVSRETRHRLALELQFQQEIESIHFPTHFWIESEVVAETERLAEQLAAITATP